jgi:hypothetical protein
MLPQTEMTSRRPPPLRYRVIVFHSCLTFNHVTMNQSCSAGHLTRQDHASRCNPAFLGSHGQNDFVRRYALR